MISGSSSLNAVPGFDEFYESAGVYYLKGTNNTIHPIGLDSAGNFIDANSRQILPRLSQGLIARLFRTKRLRYSDENLNRSLDIALKNNEGEQPPPPSAGNPGSTGTPGASGASGSKGAGTPGGTANGNPDSGTRSRGFGSSTGSGNPSGNPERTGSTRGAGSPPPQNPPSPLPAQKPPVQPPVQSPIPKRNWSGSVSAMGEQASWKYEDKSPEKGFYFNEERNRLEIDGIEAPEEVKQRLAEHYLADKGQLEHPLVKKFFASLDKPADAAGKPEDPKGEHGGAGADAATRPVSTDSNRVQDLLNKYKGEPEQLQELKKGLTQVYQKTEKTEVTFQEVNSGRHLYVFVKSENSDQKRVYPIDLKEKKLMIRPGVIASGKEIFNP